MREALQTLGTVVRRLVALSPVLIAVTTLPVALLALINAGFPAALEIAVVGWLLATPLSAILAWVVLGLTPAGLAIPNTDGTVPLPTDERAPGADADDPVALLRERFARGEIDQVEFERRLEQLLATEDAAADDGLDDLDDLFGSGGTGPGEAGPADGRNRTRDRQRRVRDSESS